MTPKIKCHQFLYAWQWIENVIQSWKLDDNHYDVSSLTSHGFWFWWIAPWWCHRQKKVQHQTMEDFYRLFQLPACGCHCWRKDLLLSWRSESWSSLHGTNSKDPETDWRTWSRITLWPPLVRSWQRRNGLGREWQRSILHFRSWCRVQVSAQTRSRPHLSSSSGNHSWCFIHPDVSILFDKGFYSCFDERLHVLYSVTHWVPKIEFAE